jgi:hypothetical protein
MAPTIAQLEARLGVDSSGFEGLTDHLGCSTAHTSRPGQAVARRGRWPHCRADRVATDQPTRRNAPCRRKAWCGSTALVPARKLRSAHTERQLQRSLR